MLKWRGEAHRGPTPRHRMKGNLLPRGGDLVFPRDELSNYLHNTKWSALKSQAHE